MAAQGKESKPNYKTAMAWHVHWVRKDPEFNKDLLDSILGGKDIEPKYFVNKYFEIRGDKRTVL